MTIDGRLAALTRTLDAQMPSVVLVCALRLCLVSLVSIAARRVLPKFATHAVGRALGAVAAVRDLLLLLLNTWALTSLDADSMLQNWCVPCDQARVMGVACATALFCATTSNSAWAVTTAIGTLLGVRRRSYMAIATSLACVVEMSKNGVHVPNSLWAARAILAAVTSAHAHACGIDEASTLVAIAALLRVLLTATQLCVTRVSRVCSNIFGPTPIKES